MITKMNKLMKMKRHIIALLVSGMAFGTASAQLAPLGAMYYHNQYLNNPAFAGMGPGLEVDLGYRQQWSTLPGSPKVQVLTGSYAMTPKAGLGLSVYNDQTGLFKHTRVMGSYAYHLPVNSKGDKLSFGISLGFMDELVDQGMMDGDPNDPSTRNFNERRQYVDGDFGIAYTSGKLSLQAAMPNLRNGLGFSKDGEEVVNEARYFAAASYRIRLSESEGVGLEPKVAFRGVRGFDNILDVGANFTFADDKIGLMAMYHSTKSTSFGVNAKLSKAFSLLGLYTSNTSALASQTNGSFELNLKINLFK
ncbi:type IX secretion system membrane protein, PorP/SprF family [Pedobacter xixiisoli]|uniref:Type IX secretion system membrane protein, PorP/SprF family n=2 Tax=Pedobacter xixiisoli TaxID=1476464 RepID=A0A285ZUR5_9SPHI|nr:type IX secretion system membrane protein, PorP/SprF family [Pedobacter xixiisoli]